MSIRQHNRSKRQHSRARRGLTTARRGLAATCVALVAGCADPSGEPEIESVDVAPAIQVDSSQDEKAKSAQQGLTGILPGDFPSDLPIYIPASLVDFGESADGRLTVSLLTPHAVSRVRRQLFSELRQNGWATAAGGSGKVVLEKGRRRAWLILEDARPGTRYRFEY